MLVLIGEQIRAARAMLKWSAKKLANESGVGWATIQRLESKDGPLTGYGHTHEAIRTALETAGVEFIAENGGGPGVRLRKL